jgi:hypothetical protein
MSLHVPVFPRLIDGITCQVIRNVWTVTNLKLAADVTSKRRCQSISYSELTPGYRVAVNVPGTRMSRAALALRNRHNVWSKCEPEGYSRFRPRNGCPIFGFKVFAQPLSSFDLNSVTHSHMRCRILRAARQCLHNRSWPSRVALSYR